MVTRRGHVQLPISLQEARTRSAQALNAIGARILSEDTAGRILAKHGVSFTSWGEDILVEISGSDSAVDVAITSSTSFPLTLVDWGTNQRNVDRFLDSLRR